MVKWFLRCLLLLLLVLLALGGWVFIQLFSPIEGTSELRGQTQEFTVEEGWLGDDVAQALKSQGLVRNAQVLSLLLRLFPEKGLFQKGVYDLPLGVSAYSLLSEGFVSPKQELVSLTIPEGSNIREVAAIISRELELSEEELLGLFESQQNRVDANLPDNLEGYLFPETYLLPPGMTEVEVAQLLTQQFREIFTPLWKQRPAGYPLSAHQAVVLASLVERETRVSKERPLVAGVYLNRLDKDMKLECDATIQYALGKQKAILTYADLELDSPYNTYMYPGLPPGPIACPGEDCLRAAIFPEKSNYLYYVRDDIRGDGSHVFGETYADHERNIREHLRE